jgi:hypothetical protein
VRKAIDKLHQANGSQLMKPEVSADERRAAYKAFDEGVAAYG